MYRYSCLFLFLALRTSSACALGEINHALSMSVVQVHAYSTSGKSSLGSGVIIAPGRVATNCHVTQRAKTVILSKGALRYEAVAQRADVSRDLCIMEAPSMQGADVSLPAAKLGRSARLSIGETVYLYGFPRAVGIAFSQGQVRSLHPYKRGRIIETSADFSEGASGGGVFNNRGELIGLATFFSAGHDRHYYAIPSDWIASLAKAVPRKIEPIDGIPFWQDPKKLPAFLRRPGR